jgi:hypothetical protein
MPSNSSSFPKPFPQFNGEREGRGPHDFSGDKVGAANDDNDNDNDNDNDDLDIGDESDEASRRPPQQASSRSQVMQRQSSYATHDRGSTSHGQHEDVDSRADGGPGGRGGASGLTDASVAANVPYHIAHLLAAALSGSMDPNRQQQFIGSLYNDPSSQQPPPPQPSANPSAVVAASSLGASLAQLLASNPYLASQLALPNLLSLGALGLNPAGGAGFPGFSGGAFGAPNPAPSQNIHPLYSTPLFASLLQPQTQQQQQQLVQNQSQSQLPPLLFPSLTQSQNQTQSEHDRESKQRPLSPRSSSGNPVKVDWPDPHSSYLPGSSMDGASTSNSSRKDGDIRARTPEPASVDGVASGSQNANIAQGSTFMEFLNAITTVSGPPQPLPNQPAPASMFNQNLNAAGFGNYVLPNNSSAGTSGQNPFSNLGLLSSLGLGIGIPGMNGFSGGGVGATQNGVPPGAFGAGSNSTSGLGSLPLGPSEQRISMQGAPSRKRTRDGASTFEDIHESDFPLSAAVGNLPPPRGFERYLNESEDGSGLGPRPRATVDLEDENRSDALQLDMGHAAGGYEEDIAGVRASKRGRAT